MPVKGCQKGPGNCQGQEREKEGGGKEREGKAKPMTDKRLDEAV